MECSEIRDLLPDYHLGNLSPDETAKITAHLAEHRECAEESESVALVLGLLAFDAEPVRPPDGGGERLMQRIIEEREDERRRDSASGREASREGSPRSSWSTSRRTALSAAVVVLTLCIVALGTLYVGLVQTNERLENRIDAITGEPELRVLSASGTDLAPDARAMLVMEPSLEGRDRIALGVYGMPEGGDYGVRAVNRSGAYESLGTMETDARGDGQMQGEMPDTDADYREIEITDDSGGDTVYLRVDLGGG